jgi:hypothetical protein
MQLLDDFKRYGRILETVRGRIDDGTLEEVTDLS